VAEFQTVAHIVDVPANGSVALELDGVPLLVCNTGDDVVVVENRCSHQDQPLEGGRIRNGYIFCPIHGMRYKLSDGEAVGQLTRVPINVFETRVVDGEVQVRLAS
jgi:3-phenylpropionate/trans-cinnamate dioxygenase ferredoxin subunit